MSGTVGFIGGGGGTAGCHIETICLCDDVNSDGSNVVEYVMVISVSCEGAVSTLGMYTDKTLQTPYVPINPVNCNDIGDTVLGVEPHTVELSGAAIWNLPNNALSVTVTVLTSAGTVPVTGYTGVINMRPGETQSWSNSTAAGGGTLIPPFSVATSTGDLVHIIWNSFAI